MKAISVRQPFALQIILGKKPYEYRSWLPPQPLVGQRLAIHASKLDAAARDELERLRLPLIGGVVLGSVRLVAVRRTRRNDGWWAWVLDDPQPLRRPVPATGKLRIWEWR